MIGIVSLKNRGLKRTWRTYCIGKDGRGRNRKDENSKYSDPFMKLSCVIYLLLLCAPSTACFALDYTNVVELGNGLFIRVEDSDPPGAKKEDSLLDAVLTADTELCYVIQNKGTNQPMLLERKGLPFDLKLYKMDGSLVKMTSLCAATVLTLTNRIIPYNEVRRESLLFSLYSRAGDYTILPMNHCVKDLFQVSSSESYYLECRFRIWGFAQGYYYFRYSKPMRLPVLPTPSKTK
jgi:hypothetical protein